MKKHLFLLVLMLLPLAAWADAVEINGIYYNLIDKNNNHVAEVTSNPNYYKGNVVIPDKVTNDGIEYIVTSIGNGAFFYCYSLTSVTIPNSVTGIGESAFQFCSGLTSVHISDLSAWCKIIFGNPNYQSNPLSNAHHLYINNQEVTNLVIPEDVTSIGNSAFSGCSGLTSVTFPNSVTSTGDYAFSGCSGLTSITIPNSVTSIGMYAFSFCSGLTSVIIGSGVSYISLNAFAGCKNLEDVYCYAENVPGTNTKAFENSLIEYATLHVPDGSVNAYSQAEPWKNFKTVVSLNGTGIANVPANDVLIQSNGGTIAVQGADDGTKVSVYGINGTLAGLAVSNNGSAIVSTNLQPGSIAIVKICEKSVKVILK